MLMSFNCSSGSILLIFFQPGGSGDGNDNLAENPPDLEDCLLPGDRKSVCVWDQAEEQRQVENWCKDEKNDLLGGCSL